MITEKPKASEKDLRCDCGKLVAIERDGKIFVQCKHCKKQIEVKLNTVQSLTS